MKNLSGVLAFIGLLACTSVMASSNNHSLSLNKLAQSLCESSKTDQVTKLRSTVMHAKTHIRTIYSQIKCDGQSLLSVAIENQSEAVVEYLKLRAKPEANVKQSQLASFN